MCCQCCKSKSFWYSKPKILANSCNSLKKLATQIEEINQDGIDIQSQKTNEQLDDEEEDKNFAIVDIEMHKWETFEDQHNPQLELDILKNNQHSCFFQNQQIDKLKQIKQKT